MLGMISGTVATGMQVAIKASGLNPVSQLIRHSIPAEGCQSHPLALYA